MKNENGDRYYLSKYNPSPIVKHQSARLQETHTDSIQLSHPNPSSPLVIYVSDPVRPEGDLTSGQYITGKSKGQGEHQLPDIKLPSLLNISVALIVMTLFLVGASMFSISLTAYSNSVDLRDQQRSNPFLVVE